jgi:hypothetical protein
MLAAVGVLLSSARTAQKIRLLILKNAKTAEMLTAPTTVEW